MNLVKLQDELRMLPLPLLDAKAKGQDPNTPPWLASAVLNERIAANEKEKLAQGAANGPMPSVAEQLQQKAGLMALQGQQQQQAQQQMMQQMAQAPQPATEQVPQPEAQPEPEQMMARGGIARLPVDERMFNYKEGGIIGFQSGGSIEEKIEEANKASLKFSGRPLSPEQRATLETRLRQEEAEIAAGAAAGRAGLTLGSIAPQRIDQQKPAVAPQQVPAVAQPRPSVITSTAPGRGQVGRDDSSMTNAPVRMTPELEAFIRADAEREGIGAPVFNFRGPKGGIAGLARQPEEQPTPAPALQVAQPAPQAGLPAALAQTAPDPLVEAKRFAEAMQLPQKQDLASVRALRQQALREAGLPKDVGTQLGEGISRYEAESERIRKAREKADALYVLSGRGGLGDIAARAAHRESVNALADSIRNDKANEMRTAMESARRAEAMGDVAEVRRQMDLYNKAAEERGKATVTAATALAGQRTTERGQTLQAGVGLAQIGSQENIHELDRKLRETLHNTPSAQRASVEENAIRDYMRQFNLSYADAYAKVKQVASGFKGEMTLDQATQRIDKMLDSAQGSMYIREIQKKAKEEGKPVPDFYTIRKQLIDQEMGGSARPTVSNSPLLSAADKIVSGGK